MKAWKNFTIFVHPNKQLWKGEKKVYILALCGTLVTMGISDPCKL
jgi:hypothetical protein